MQKLRLLLILPVVALAALLLASSPLRATTTKTVIDATPKAGEGVVVITSENLPVITYQIGFGGGVPVKLAICNDLPCTAPTIRDITAYGGSVGLDLFSDDRPILSTNNVLHVCDDPTCATITTINLPSLCAGPSEVRVNSADLPVIACRGSGGTLLIYTCNDAACSAPTTHDTGVAINPNGIAPVLELNGDNPVALSVDDTSNATLTVSVCDNAPCTSTTSNVVSDPANNASYGVYDLALNASGLPFVTFHAKPGLDLVLARCSTATCEPGSITYTIVDAGNGYFGGYDSGIVIDDAGNPAITYGWNTSGLTWRLVRCYDPDCASTVKPPDYTFIDWQEGSSTTYRLSVGSGALQLVNNNPVISYSRTNFSTLESESVLAVCDTPRCLEPGFVSTPEDGNTLTIKGAGGNTVGQCLFVQNQGEDGSGLNVLLESLSSGYTITFPTTFPLRGMVEPNIGLNGRVQYSFNTCVNVTCVIPQDPGSLTFRTNETGEPTYTYALNCIQAAPDLVIDVQPDSTINLNGPAGQERSATITVNNIGDADSELQVNSVFPLPTGYQFTGLPISGLKPADGSKSFTVSCTPPVAAAQFKISTNEAGYPQYTYNLTCDEGEVATVTPTTEATETPTEAPTDAATGVATEAPTDAATSAATEAPTDAATSVATEAPTDAATGVATATNTDIPTGIDILENGDFEAQTGEGKPDLTPWVVKQITSDKIKCNKETKPVAYTGDCAFVFKGGTGEFAAIQQVPDLTSLTFAANDTLTFSAFVKATNDAAAGKIKVRVKYSDGSTKGKLNLPIVVSASYAELTSSLTIASAAVSKVKVQIRHSSLAGKVNLDAVSVRVEPAVAIIPLP